MPSQPNVLLVLCDQMRADAMGCMGNDAVRTPTLDRIASEGRLFTRAYSPDPVCSPTRGSILTGCYPHVHGEIENHMRLPTGQPTLSRELADAGYETGYIGKWHLDGDAYPGHIPPGPRRHGFDYWRGFNRGHEYYNGHPCFTDDGDLYWEEGYQPTVQTDMAIDFIEEQDETDNPFFLYLSWGPPHTPFDAPDEYSDTYDPEALDLRPNVPDDWDTTDLREDLAEYYALITSLDDQLDRLVQSLERNDLARDTIVLFLSDHGEMLGSQGRERKGYPFEESIHVPLVLWCPDRIEAGESSALVSLVDLMPTLLSLCDVSVPASVQGMDLSSRVEGAGDRDEAGHEALYLEGQLRSDETWRTVRTDDHMLTVNRQLDTQYFFDMADDPYQQENLAGRKEVEDQETALRERLFALAREYGDRHVVATEVATRTGSDSLTPRGGTFEPSR